MCATVLSLAGLRSSRPLALLLTQARWWWIGWANAVPVGRPPSDARP